MRAQRAPPALSFVLTEVHFLTECIALRILTSSREVELLADSRLCNEPLYTLCEGTACDRLGAYPPRLLLSRQLKNVIVWIIYNVQGNCQCASQLLQLCQ
jgi:hypothetical protein